MNQSPKSSVFMANKSCGEVHVFCIRCLQSRTHHASVLQKFAVSQPVCFGAAKEMMKGLTERQKADLVNQRMQANNLSRQKGSQAGPAARDQQRSSSHPSNGTVNETSLHSCAAKESGAVKKGH
jgi:hypothetical protein